MNLIAGPFIGEFGWEVCAWQGVLRVLKEQYDKVVVYGRPGHQYLYQDFADKYHEFTPQGKEPNMWMNEGTKFMLPEKYEGDVWIKPQQLSLMPNAPEQHFVCYGEQGKHDGYDIVCHARMLYKYGSDNINTPIELWNDILKDFKGLKIASIGTRDGAAYIPGTTDCRGVSLEETANILANSKVLIGPSSGPMHFGSLCNIPLVVWSGYARSRPRYETLWNPFRAQVHVIDDGDPWGQKKQWQPDPKDVIANIEAVLRTNETVDLA